MSDAFTFIKRLRPKNPSAKLVLFALSEHVDENGFAQPSSKRLAADADLSERTVSTALDFLVEVGMIRRQRAYEGRKRKPDVIELIGFVVWRNAVDAELASTRAKYMQGEQVQNLHVPNQTQDVVVVSVADTTQVHANLARASEAPQKENSPTPPIRKTTPLSCSYEQDIPEPAFKLEPPAPSKPRATNAGAKRSARIDPHWKPDAQTQAYAKQLGFEVWEIEAASVEFREYWQERTDKGSARANWDLSFKRRLRDLAAEPKMRAKLKFVTPAVNGHALITPELWQTGLEMWRNGRRWIKDLGPKPDQPGYRGPSLEHAA